MNGPCPNMPDRIADYVLGALDAEQAEALRRHLDECSDCRRYWQQLQEQAGSLAGLGREIGRDMMAREDRVIDALREVAPGRRVSPLLSGFVKAAVAAVLLLGAGITIGRWTAPRPVDLGQLRTDIEAAVAKSVDQRLQAEAQQRAELARQTYQDLHALAQQAAAGSASLERLMNGKFAELVDIIEAGRETDRWRVEKALLEMKTRTGLGLQALAVRAGDTATTVHD